MNRLLSCFLVLACSVWCSDALACDTVATAKLDSTCVVMSREGVPGVWFELKAADALRKQHLIAPELELQLKDVNTKLETREWQLERYREVVELKDAVIATQQEAVGIHARRERAALDALGAWYRSPLLWAGIGAAITTGIFMAVSD